MHQKIIAIKLITNGYALENFVSKKWQKYKQLEDMLARNDWLLERITDKNRQYVSTANEYYLKIRKASFADYISASVALNNYESVLATSGYDLFSPYHSVMLLRRNGRYFFGSLDIYLPALSESHLKLNAMERVAMAEKLLDLYQRTLHLMNKKRILLDLSARNISIFQGRPVYIDDEIAVLDPKGQYKKIKGYLNFSFDEIYRSLNAQA